ncbi:MAG TPA: acyl-CoA thioesterase II [Pseudonocardiaceae bacterium]|jgi:acyl-CoA thioesterase-2|nr:acyl-CoA thioesterase II [Pseudonocardiaceae bacterium]
MTEPALPAPGASRPQSEEQEWIDAPRSADGVPCGQPVVDRLVALLDLERIEDNIFRGLSLPEFPVRVFGGQVAGQALVAAGRTVPPERSVHSLHAYFIRAGDPRVPIVYDVDRIRDGQSFTTRRVVGIQHGRAIFSLAASFQMPEQGLDHADKMPEVAPPEQLDDLATWVRRVGDTQALITRIPRSFDLRYVTPPVWAGAGDEAGPGEHNQLWMRADGVLPDDALAHVCMLAYASDLTLLWSVAALHRRVLGHGVMAAGVIAASLDHAMWFHRPFRADEWVLFDCTSPSATGGRGLATGRFFSRDGRLIASVVQEGLVRVRL